jgi:predicted PurR-regulated permease PerM
VPERLRNSLGALVVGAIFLAGLIIHGALGGVLLLFTAVVLAILTSAVWHRMRARDRAVRILIILVVIVIGLAFFAAS